MTPADDQRDEPRPPAPRPKRRRTGTALENDVRILAAALRVLRLDGYDGLGMRQVAREAGLKSTGALYGRFENVAELAVWVWTEKASAALTDISSRAVALLDGLNPDPAAEDEARAIAAALVDMDDDLRAAFELLAVVPRVDELDEVVRPEILALLNDLGARPGGDRQRRAQVLGQLSLAWGIGLLALPGTLPPFEWWRPLSGTIGLAHEETRATESDPIPIPLPEPTGEDTVRSRLLTATGVVVARTGVEGATLSRIARRAGYTTGIIYEHFDSKDDLMTAWVDRVFRLLYTSMARTEGEFLSEGTFTELSAGLLASLVVAPARPLQRLKVELYLAAAHEPAIAASLGPIFDQHTAERVARYAEAGMGRAEAAVAPGASQAVNHGLALVESVAWPIGEVEWGRWVEPLLARYL